jgi:hypothetical protein
MRFTPAALLATALLATPAFAADMAPIRSITVNGLAQRKVVPDEAHIQVNLNSQDKDMKAARAAHDKKLAKLMEIVKSAGIDEKKVRSQYSNVQPIYTYVNDTKGASQRVFQGYRVQTSVDVTVSDTAKLSGLIESIGNAGFEQGANTEWGDLLSVNYQLSNPDKIRDEMLALAIANAKEKADRMAGAAGASLGNVYSINEGGTPQFQPIMAPRPMLMKADMAASAPAMAPPAGEQQVESNVTVTYELK